MKISASLLPVLGTQAVKVIPSDKRLVKQLHDNLFLSCFGSDLEWVNPKGHAISTKQRSQNIYVESRSEQLRLWIKNLRMEDVGDYTCRSSNEQDGKFEVRNVMVRPEVDFKTEEQQLFIEGVDAEIACDFAANGLDTIVEWYAPGNPNPLLPNSGNNLLVENIGRDDGGIYRCTVITTDTGDVDDVDILVEIEYPPKIEDFINVPADSEVWLTEGQNFSVPCEAAALPEPEITWSRETAEGENDVIGNENNLMFTDIRLENSGKYICAAKNEHGSVSASFNLVVLPPPTTLVNDQLVDGNSDFPYFVNLGDPMKFVCENMYPADFVWTTPDGSQAAMDQLNRIAETTDSGFYTCTATIKRGRTNEMIEVSSSVNVQVRFQPMIATEELEIYSYPGLETNIPCSFMANPVGFTSISGPQIEEELLLNEVNYVFKAQQEDFPSTFLCKSRNDLGKEEYEVRLLKAEKPKELRLLKLVQKRPDRVVISYSRDYSKGQIDLSNVVVHLSSAHRPDVVRTVPVDNQNHVTIEDLEPERTYVLRLQGINAVGESPVSKKLEFTTDALGAPVVQINRVSSDNGQYYVDWEITNNGGGRMRELKLQYGMYKNAEMIKIGDISDFPKSNSGKIKIADLQKNENYWVLLTAKNEKLPSKTVRCDVTAKASSQNRVLFLAIGSSVFLLIVGLAIDVTCYFTKQQGLLNRIVARKIPVGAKPIGANSSEEASSTESDEAEEKCLKSKLEEDSEDQGMGSLTESATRLETVKEVGEN